ncbi:MAG: hypothetical protein Pars2KO_19200 [Parasphingorhabdus sp.]
MTSKLKLLVATSAVSVAMLGANPAFAAGTASGTDITNSVTITYNVGGVAQTPPPAASDTFTVDRKVDLTVAQADTSTTSVSPGESDAVTTFTVTNTSNATLDFALTAAQGAAVNGGIDSFDVTGFQIFVEEGTNPGYQVGEDTATFINALAADSSETVYILADIPLTQSTGDVSGVVLTATAHESTSGSLDALVTETAGANTASVDTVFADGDGPGSEGSEDGAHSAGDDYTVAAADISVTKSSVVLWDPINGSTNPKAIPGAVVEYCIAVANAASGADATGVALSDTIPANLTYYSSLATGAAPIPAVIGVVTEGSVTGSTCNADGTGTGSEASGVVTGNLGTVTSGDTETLVFRVTVD